jgi:two-component system CheB/CheR fusion protein
MTLQSERTGLRVLLVEDDAELSRMLVETLVANGHEARVAHDGPAGLAACADFKPAVALLDIGLPGMDGHALAERLRTLPGMENLRIVAVTGYGEQSYRRRSRSAGFDRHLVKPIDIVALERMLRVWVDQDAERR